jgi:hypothetical protein
MSVERGPAQAVCQAQILNAKALGSSSRRRHDETTGTAEQPLDDTWCPDWESCYSLILVSLSALSRSPFPRRAATI